MRLLVDSDAFCKLALANLLHEAAALFGAQLGECGRLPALPYMLRRGSLPRVYGSTACQQLIPVVQNLPAVSGPSGPWLESFAPAPEIDPGEAILFSIAAERGLPVISGDLRALRALKDIEGIAAALAGQIVIQEAVLIGLCNKLGADLVRDRLVPVLDLDNVVRVCFSPDNPTPESGLRSYLRERVTELTPLVLWDPIAGEDA